MSSGASRRQIAFWRRALADVAQGPKGANSVLAQVADPSVSATVRSTTYRSVVAGFQKRNRNPTVGAMLLRWRKPDANPPLTCVNMIPE